MRVRVRVRVRGRVRVRVRRDAAALTSASGSGGSAYSKPRRAMAAYSSCTRARSAAGAWASWERRLRGLR